MHSNIEKLEKLNKLMAKSLADKLAAIEGQISALNEGASVGSQQYKYWRDKETVAIAHYDAYERLFNTLYSIELAA